MNRISTSGEFSGYRSILKARGPLRRPGVVLLVAGVAISFLIGACGDSGNGGPAATATVSQASGNGGEPTLPANGGVEPTSISGTEDLFVPATQWRDFMLELSTGDKVMMSYAAEFRIVGRSEGNIGGIESGVLVVVANPVGEQVFQAEKAEEGTVEITAELPGEYTFTFFNNFQFQGQSVDVEYVINP